MHISNHKLFDKSVAYFNNEKNTKQMTTIDTIVIHFTAGASGISSARYLAKNNTKSSAHLVIDHIGIIWQLVHFNIVAWHAGRSRLEERYHVNNFSIGIELANYGKLKHVGNRFFTWFRKPVPSNQVLTYRDPKTGKLTFWHKFPEYQIQVTQTVIKLLIKHYPIKNIVGHSEISLNGKMDPGPAFPLDAIRHQLMPHKYPINH